MHPKGHYNDLLPIHDTYDKILPQSNSMAIYKKWPNAELKLVKKTGHYKMLWDEQVIDMVIDRLNGKDNNKQDNSLYAMVF